MGWFHLDFFDLCCIFVVTISLPAAVGTFILSSIEENCKSCPNCQRRPIDDLVNDALKNWSKCTCEADYLQVGRSRRNSEASIDEEEIEVPECAPRSVPLPPPPPPPPPPQPPPQQPPQPPKRTIPIRRNTPSVIPRPKEAQKSVVQELNRSISLVREDSTIVTELGIVEDNCLRPSRLSAKLRASKEEKCLFKSQGQGDQVLGIDVKELPTALLDKLRSNEPMEEDEEQRLFEELEREVSFSSRM